MKPLSERDENICDWANYPITTIIVGMKPLSERDENLYLEKNLFNLFKK